MSSGSRQLPDQRGAGGKLRRPSARRPPVTPYARPQRNQADRNSSRWLSRLVDPACRIISGGANLFFPSFFLRSQSTTSDLEEREEEEEEGGEREELEEHHGNSGVNKVLNATNADNDSNVNLNNEALRSVGVAGTSRVALEGNKQCQEADASHHNGLFEIEQLVMGKQLSRDQVNRLIEIVRSREANLHAVEQEKTYSSTPVGEVRGSASSFKQSGNPTEEKQEDLAGPVQGISNNQGRVVPGDFRGPEVFLQNSTNAAEERHEDLNVSNLGAQTPLFQSTVRDNVGTSPAEIARAYMESRSGFGTKILISKDGGTLHTDNAVASKPFFPSPSLKPSTCWPGALVQDQGVYTTPQSQRGIIVNNFTLNPNSSYSKSKSKLTPFRGVGDRSLNMKPTPLWQSETRSYGQVGSRGNALGNGNGSVGPVRRIRQKFDVGTPSRGSPYFGSPLTTPDAENFNTSEDSFSTLKKNLEKGETSNSSKFLVLDSKPQSSEVIVPTVPAHSSQMARKILEHLERNPPTPKDKIAELKLATSWRQQRPDATTIAQNKHDDITQLGVFGSKQSDQGNKRNLLRWREESGKSLSNASSQKVVSQANGAVNNDVSSSEIKDSSNIPSHSDDANFRKSWGFQPASVHEDVSKGVANGAGPEQQSLLSKPPSIPSGNKPVLTSISVGNPNQGWMLSSDKSSGFTFPVSASSGVLSEPPTPSMMPLSSSGSGDLHLNDADTIPSYSFGSKGSSTPLVFSFPSISNAPVPPEAQNLPFEFEFEFGSNKTPRISFSSVGKDAICC